MTTSYDLLGDLILHRLRISDFQYVEIESKKRVSARHAKDLRRFLVKKKRVQHVKASTFFDQFLDTPHLDLLRSGASMRIRYKKNGSDVYLQYKGPGFIEDGLLYRSEFSSQKLEHVFLEESHHDIIRFTKTSVQNILAKYVGKEMRSAMQTHLGKNVMANISHAPIIGVYQKDKFAVKLGSGFLEPSVDRVFAFHINKKGMHPLSTFCEYENEVKSKNKSPKAKLEHIQQLLDFDESIAREFSMKPELLDKYHRCTSIFLPKKTRPPVR